MLVIVAVGEVVQLAPGRFVQWKTAMSMSELLILLLRRGRSIETEPFLGGGNIDVKQNGPELGIWELDLRSQFPALFVPYKEAQLRIPHSDTLEKCSSKNSEFYYIIQVNLLFYSTLSINLYS